MLTECKEHPHIDLNMCAEQRKIDEEIEWEGEKNCYFLHDG
jgi:hypothetical protein